MHEISAIRIIGVNIDPLKSVTSHFSDSPFFRRPIVPTTHCSDDQLFRQPINPTNYYQVINKFMPVHKITLKAVSLVERWNPQSDSLAGFLSDSNPPPPLRDISTADYSLLRFAGRWNAGFAEK